MPYAMGREHRNFIEQLQSLDERKKTKVLVAVSLVAMIVVIYLWLAYFNSTIMTGIAGQEAAPENNAQAAPTAQGPSMFSSIGTGFTNIGRALGNIFNAPREIEVKPQ